MDSAPPAKISFSLKSKAKPKPTTSVPTQASAFGSFDEEVDPPAPAPAKPGKGGPKPHVATQTILTKAMKKEMEEQQKVDSTVYQYDEVYDRLKEAERLAEVAREEEAKIRQPKYISNLLQAADQRKRDHLLAEEKMIQKERQMEGEEFADKEKFVTQAYKDQLAANRQEEEAQKLREGMTYFYETLLKDSEQKHAAVMAAASRPTIGPTMPASEQSLAIRPPTEAGELSDLEKARRARLEGKEVELNDDNQIVDKRALLTAGLNLAGKNTWDPLAYRQNRNQQDDKPVQTHTAVGSAASRREIDARRRKEVESQMTEEKERRVREKEKEEEEARMRAVKRKNDDEAVMSARERYLERKRRKLEEPPPEEE
ncbi:14950_t:CDS:2 [Acaulospora colombiana]|uniref:14947_t:CDS:1 n=2 Tax=Acaulospora colombiana TaxID=27376 RepID=A0ACA9MUS7_9GLOM|nr:14947_t:CDS:2 [Acaulospora colombiana]CAG8606613.1 14950_t:CDS:2 [Acaulospora colombiana]